MSITGFFIIAGTALISGISGSSDAILLILDSISSRVNSLVWTSGSSVLIPIGIGSSGLSVCSGLRLIITVVANMTSSTATSVPIIQGISPLTDCVSPCEIAFPIKCCFGGSIFLSCMSCDACTSGCTGIVLWTGNSIAGGFDCPNNTQNCLYAFGFLQNLSALSWFIPQHLSYSGATVLLHCAQMYAVCCPPPLEPPPGPPFGPPPQSGIVVCWHPFGSWQKSLVHWLPSSQSGGVPGTQSPSSQVSCPLHACPSLQSLSSLHCSITSTWQLTLPAVISLLNSSLTSSAGGGGELKSKVYVPTGMLPIESYIIE